MHRLIVDDQVKWVREKADIEFDAEGSPAIAVGFTQDLTGLKQVEEALRESELKFKSLFEQAPLSYQALDENGNFIEVNQTWLETMGYKRDEVLGKNFSEFLVQEWKNHFAQNFPRFKAVGEILGVEFEMVKKDGTVILVSIQGKIGKNPDGSFVQTHCVLNDVTNQKQLIKEKEIMEQKMAQMQKIESIGTLAGGIAHDFNNILFPITGLSEMLMEDLAPDSPERENVEEIFKAAMRARDLVRQILAFSRQTEHQMIPVRVQQIITEVLKLGRSTIPANIKIIKDIQNDCGRVLADPGQIHQVLMNLITNAYHAVEQTNGSISVRLEEATLEGDEWTDCTLEAGQYAKLSVYDTGCGIDPALMDKIFDPYFTTKEQGKGTGLGLSVVYGLVRGHRGDIRVCSEAGEGTTFTVYLPLIKKSCETAPAVNKEIDKTGTERILLVDDEIQIVKMVKKILESLGYRVISRTGSPDALDAFKTDPNAFDLVLTDMTMPDMTGDQLAKELITIRPDIPIIICTGFSERINSEKAAGMGIKGFLMKPIIKSEMARMVRNVLDEARGI